METREWIFHTNGKKRPQEGNAVIIDEPTAIEVTECTNNRLVLKVRHLKMTKKQREAWEKLNEELKTQLEDNTEQ